jgi:hypothetical protein
MKNILPLTAPPPLAPLSSFPFIQSSYPPTVIRTSGQSLLAFAESVAVLDIRGVLQDRNYFYVEFIRKHKHCHD